MYVYTHVYLCHKCFFFAVTVPRTLIKDNKYDLCSRPLQSLYKVYALPP